MKKVYSIFRAVIFTSFVFVPLTSFAAEGVTVRDAITGIGATAILINLFTATVVKSLATLALSVALLAFFFGIVEYIWAKRQGDGKGVENGNKFMTWGLIALFVMFSVYGIIKLGQSVLFQGKDVTTIDVPSFNFNVKQGTSKDVLNNNLSNPNNTVQQGTLPVGTQRPTQQQGVINVGNGSGSNGTSGCPSGQVYDSDTGQCLKSVLPSNTSSCPSDQVYDSDTGQCVQSVLSPEIRCANSGGSYNNGNCIMPD